MTPATPRRPAPRVARSARRVPGARAALGLAILAGAVASMGIAPPGAAAEVPPPPPTVPALALAAGDERLEYRWHVQGFFGAFAGLFFPSEGEGSLTRRALPNGNLESELLITSKQDGEPDFFRYGAETERVTGATLRAWSSQLWRGKRKEKASPVTTPGAVDVASAIQRLRAKPPGGAERLEIWSDGKLYPVEVAHAGAEKVKIAGREVPTRRVSVRPLVEPERRVWKGELDLWFADDAAATPVRMMVARPPVKVSLELVRYP